MDVQTASTLVNSLAFLAVTASVLVLMRQAKEMSRQSARLGESLLIDASISMMSLFGRVSDAFLAHPELRAVFYESDGEPKLVSEADRQRALVIAELISDLLESWFLLRGESAIYDRVGRTYEQYTHDAFLDSAFLTDYVLERREWFHADLVAEALAARQQRDDSAAAAAVPKARSRKQGRSTRHPSL